MAYILIAGLLGIGVPFVSLQHWKVDSILMGVRVVINIFFAWLVWYFAAPSWQTSYSWLGFLWWWILGLAMQFVFNFPDEEDQDDVSSGAIFVFDIVFAFSSLVILFWYGIVTPLHNRTTTYKDAHVTVATGTIPSIDGKDIPIVPSSTAKVLANNALQNYGSQYQIDSMEIQRYHGQLWWVGALDFRGIFQWNTEHYSPGYVMVSATNPDTSPILVTNYKLFYTPNAAFRHDLYRHISRAYPQYYIGSTDLEPDPSGKPYWVASLFRPNTSGTLRGSQVAGVLMVDPTTGAMTFYHVGQQPSWVSQVVGRNFVRDKLSAWGTDENGWPNASLIDVKQPVSDPIGVVGKKGQLYWYTGFTSVSGSDNALMGYALTDAETGDTTYYSAKGLDDGNAAISRVDGAVSNTKLAAEEPVFYNLYGRPAFIMAVVNGSNNIVDYSIVDPTNGASPIVATTMQDALAKWQSYVATGGGTNTFTSQSQMSTLTGKVAKIEPVVEQGDTVWYFTIHGSNALFSATIKTADIMPFVRAGDTITVKYMKVTSDINPVASVVIRK